MAMYELKTKERVMFGFMAGISMMIGLSIIYEKNSIAAVAEILLLMLGTLVLISANRGEIIWWCERPKETGDLNGKTKTEN